MIIWGNLTNEEVEKLDKNIPVILPMGLIEIHGPHMTVDFDNESAPQYITSF